MLNKTEIKKLLLKQQQQLSKTPGATKAAVEPDRPKIVPAPATVATLKTCLHAEPVRQIGAMAEADFWQRKQSFCCHMCGLPSTAYPLMYPMRRAVSPQGVTTWTGRGLLAHWHCLYRYGM